MTIDPGLPNTETGKSRRLAVILAGGNGARLRPLTRLIAGDDRPKQFCPILNGGTLLDKTRERTAVCVAPADTFFSLTATHERYYKRLLWDAQDRQLIVQPENRGTAPAILYSLMRLASAEPDATVAFFPSDHYFSDDRAFMDVVDSAFASAEVDPDSVILIGIEPDKAESSYGWIEPAASLFGDLARSAARVKRFWEKPSPSAAARLMAAGCLWNSFVMVGKAGAFLEMFRSELPDLYRMFRTAMPYLGTPQEKAAIRSIYAWIDETNFSTDVLERSAGSLLVMRAGNVGWSDLGEPQRVASTLSALGIAPEWMQAAA